MAVKISIKLINSIKLTKTSPESSRLNITPFVTVEARPYQNNCVQICFERVIFLPSVSYKHIYETE